MENHKQKKISHFFTSIPSKKARIQSDETQSNKTEPSEQDPEPSLIQVNPKYADLNDGALSCSDLPKCWSQQQANEFTNMYKWLVVVNGALGCKICSQVGNLSSGSKQGAAVCPLWSSNGIKFSGSTKKAQQKSLRNKIYSHRDSQTHMKSTKIMDEAKTTSLEDTVFKLQSQDTEATTKIFRCAYYIAKSNRPFTDLPKLIELQQLNGIDAGRILHSRKSCTAIINHIAHQMKKSLCNKIVETNSKIAIIIDESTTLSKLSTLIIYLRVYMPDDSWLNPVNTFFDLVELNDTSAQGICSKLLSALDLFGIGKNYLKNNLVAIGCDGAAVLMGNKNGVVKRLKEFFPDIVVWHCYNHRLELCVSDVVKKITGVNHFKMFMDKLYSLYHASPKNAREIKECALELDIQILKIGRVLDIRWVASSYRTVNAVWQNYFAICKHFVSASEDKKRDSRDRSMYLGLLKQITKTTFVLNLALMCDALQELSELSLEFQSREINIFNAHQSLMRQLRVFESRRTNPGPCYKIALNACEDRDFKSITLHDDNSTRKINPTKFYYLLEKQIKVRMLSPEDEVIPNLVKVLRPEYWPNNIKSNLTYGEEEISQLCQMFKVGDREILREFRHFIQNWPDIQELPENVAKLINWINVIPISSSECERGFLQMNLLMVDIRSSLLVTNVSSLLFIKMVGPPLPQFDPIQYVKTWIASGHRGATETQGRLPGIIENPYPDLKCLWSLF